MELDMESEQVVRHGKGHGTVEMGKNKQIRKKNNDKQLQNHFKMKTKNIFFSKKKYLISTFCTLRWKFIFLFSRLYGSLLSGRLGC